MRLEINGQQADYEGIIAISKQTLDSDNLGISLIDISNKIVLPKSDKNKAIILGGDRLESEALDVVYDAKIIDGYFLFNGTAILSEAGDTWRIQLADKSKLLFNDLKQKINELDFEADDFTYITANYNILKTKTDSVWIWPVVQMHESISETNLQYLRPHFRYWNLLQKAFLARDYILNFDTSLIQSLGIQANSQDFKFTSYQKTLNGLTIGALTSNDFNYGVVVAAITIDVGLLNKTAFRLRGDITSLGESKITFNDDEIIINDGTNFYDETTSELEGVVTIILTGTVNFVNTLLYTTIKESSFDDIGAFSPINYKVKAFDNLPDISQKDLFKDALILTNSIIDPDTLRGTINIRTLAALNSQNKVDWSEKFIEDSESIKSNIGGLSKKNLLTFENGVGDNYFNTDIDYLEDEKPYLKLRYSGSPDKTDFAVYNVYEVDADGNNVRANGDELRLVYIDGNFGKFTPVNWASLKSAYWGAYFDSLNKPRSITAKFNLKKLDVVGFDKLTLVYIDKFNANFIVESINNYTTGQETSVKLLRYGR